MLISDVLRGKGHHVVKVQATDPVHVGRAQAGRTQHRCVGRRGQMDEAASASFPNATSSMPSRTMAPRRWNFRCTR